MKKHVFFLGKGGVGKTTLAAAVSASLAAAGKRTLIASLDPAHNLGDVFGKRLDGARKAVLPGLDALEVDVRSWIERSLNHAREEIRERYSYAMSLNLDPFLEILRLAPGSEEYAVLWAIEHVHTALGKDYDAVVFDTPPTALTLRFLSMPALCAAWVRELSRMRALILGKRQTLLKIDPEASVVRGATRTEDDAVSLALSGIGSRLRGLHELFSRDSYMAVGVNPDALSLSEALRIKKSLDTLAIPLGSVFLNKAAGDADASLRVRGAFGDLPLFAVAEAQAEICGAAALESLDVTDLVKHYMES